MQIHWIDWARASGVPLLAAAVAFAIGWSNGSSNRWQVKIAREKLKHDLYDRRFAVYMAFHELTVAVSEKKDVDAELRKANEARAHSPFLFDTGMTRYLQDMYNEAFRINATNKFVGDLDMGDAVVRMNAWTQHSADKLTLANRIPELVEKVECLKLTDLSK